MLPGVSPCAVGQGIANAIVGNGITVIAGEQIAPVLIAVGVPGNLWSVPGGATPPGV